MMQVEQWTPESPARMTFDEVSMERSKSFVMALQELKNLRPQLYSAAEYCEKSYLHSEKKQMVLDNLKDYAVKALVNAVDHLGTVAYKLTDLFEQQSVDVSSVELKISCLNQQILTCQHYMDKEGLRQQQLLGTSIRHHKHYFLPNSNAGKTRIGSQLNASGTNHDISDSRSHSPGNPASKTLSWYLASESNSMPNKSSSFRSEQDSMFSFSFEGSKAYKATPHDFHLLDAVESTVPLSTSPHLDTRNGTTQSHIVPRYFGYKDLLEVPKPLSTLKSLDNPHREIIRPTARNKSVLSLFFAKSKYSRQWKAYA